MLNFKNWIISMGEKEITEYLELLKELDKTKILSS